MGELTDDLRVLVVDGVNDARQRWNYLVVVRVDERRATGRSVDEHLSGTDHQPCAAGRASSEMSSEFLCRLPIVDEPGANRPKDATVRNRERSNCCGIEEAHANRYQLVVLEDSAVHTSRRMLG
jgi:hypothetical protein